VGQLHRMASRLVNMPSNKSMNLTKSTLSIGAVAFAGYAQRSADVAEYRRLMTRLALVLFLSSAGILVGLDESSEPTATCPSFKDLGKRLDERIAGIKPGTSLQEFTEGFASRALNFDDPKSREGALFFVGVTEGNATVVDELQCRFDSHARLISCRRECCRSESRSITLAQYDSLAVGQLRQDVEARLCSPSDVERKGLGKIQTYYHIPLPVGHHWEGQTVLLEFENDRLTFKDMSPYY
jgi:hypothetical protein